MSVLHQSMCIFKAGLPSSNDGWGKYKEKVPDVSGPNQKCSNIMQFPTQVYIAKDLFISRLQKN